MAQTFRGACGLHTAAEADDQHAHQQGDDADDDKKFDDGKRFFHGDYSN